MKPLKYFSPTIFSAISHLQDTKDLNVHSVIGYHVLSKQKTLISYARKTLTFMSSAFLKPFQT